MKFKILNFLLIVTSLIGYLEWSGDSKAFLFQAEADILYKLFTNPTSVIHPFILLPLAGQLILLITLFQKEPSKILTYIGMFGLSILLGFMFAIGILSGNIKILAFSIPFLVVTLITFVQIKKHRK